jgi:hypothetical protein
MKYKIETKYCWYQASQERVFIVRMYFIQGIPFKFDDLEGEGELNLNLVEIANSTPSYDVEELYHYSFYLIAEECHPMLFELDLENPELLPVD